MLNGWKNLSLEVPSAGLSTGIVVLIEHGTFFEISRRPELNDFNLYTSKSCSLERFLVRDLIG